MKVPTIFISRDLKPLSPFYTTFTNQINLKAYSLLKFTAIPFTEFKSTDFIFFYSANAVRFFCSQLGDNQKISAKLCCMGEGTADILKQYHSPIHFIGNGNIDKIAADFLKICKDKSVLFPRAKQSKQSIQKRIQAYTSVVDLMVYNNEKKPKFEHPQADILIFTSPMNVASYFDLFPYRKETLVAIGDSTKQKLNELGFKTVHKSKESSEQSLVEEIQNILNEL